MIEGTIEINSRRLVSELNTFIWNQRTRRAEAQKGKHDDAIMALAIAIYVRDSSMRDIPVGAPVPAELGKVFKTELYESIKRQILAGAPDDYFKQDPEDLFSDIDVLPGIVTENGKNSRTRKLLDEFGW